MRRTDDDYTGAVNEKLAGSLFIVAFGLAVLAFLTAIEHKEWFSLRPASGSAAAMAYAAQPVTDTKPRPLR